MFRAWIRCNRKLEEVPENDGFVEDDEDDEVDIDDEFEEIEEEDFEENNDSGFKWQGCMNRTDLPLDFLFNIESSLIGRAHSKIQ